MSVFVPDAVRNIRELVQYVQNVEMKKENHKRPHMSIVYERPDINIAK